MTQGVGCVSAGLVVDQVGAGGGDGARGVEESQEVRHPLRTASRATSHGSLWGGNGGGEGFGELVWGEIQVIRELGDGKGGVGEEVKECGGGMGSGTVFVIGLRR